VTLKCCHDGRHFILSTLIVVKSNLKGKERMKVRAKKMIIQQRKCAKKGGLENGRPSLVGENR
jgi:hypothetical protein